MHDLGALYAAHAPAVARWAQRLGGAEVDVEDVVHEVFLVVERRLATFRGESSITTWLYGITANVVRYERRRRRLWRARGCALAELEPRSPLPTPAEAIERREAARFVHAILDRMTETHR